MKKIRHGTFETNSSSTHSLQLVDTDLFTRWINGEKVWYGRWDDEFISKEDIVERVKSENNINEINEDNYELLNNEIQSLEDNGYVLYSEFEYEYESIDLKDGRTAFSYYGYD